MKSWRQERLYEGLGDFSNGRKKNRKKSRDLFLDLLAAIAIIALLFLLGAIAIEKVCQITPETGYTTQQQRQDIYRVGPRTLEEIGQ